MDTQTITQTSEPQVLKCQGTADFLAALPQITGFTAENSLFLVLFSGKRAGHVIRVDLPEDDSPVASLHLLDFICQAAHGLGSAFDEPSAPAIVISSAQTFADAPGAPWARLARRIERRLRRERIELRELCCIAPDGWASYFEPGAPQHSLSEISESPMAADPAPDLSALGNIPSPDPVRLTKVEHWLDEFAPYDFPGAGAPSPTPPAPGEPSHSRRSSWIAQTEAVSRALLGRGLSPRMTARLIRSAAHSDRWIVMVLGVLTRPEFPGELAQELGRERFEGVPAYLEENRASESCWSLFGLLTAISFEFAEQERLTPLRERLLTAISETPRSLRPGLLAFSAWIWWLSGSQTVAQRHIDEALSIDPAHEITLVVERLTSIPLYARFFPRPLARAA